MLCLAVSLGSSNQPEIAPLPGTTALHDPQEIVKRLNDKFQLIHDARADFKLETSLQIFGCAGSQWQAGELLFKAPDNIKIRINGYTYIFKGNFGRRFDPDGKEYWVRFVHAPDFSIGFHPGLLSHNFYLTIIKDDPAEIIMEGLPKPGVLKNVNKVTFHIDPREDLLRSMDISFHNVFISGRAAIDYEKVNDLWVPISTYGKSAFEPRSGFLIGFSFKLIGSNFKINTDIPTSEFN